MQLEVPESTQEAEVGGTMCVVIVTKVVRNRVVLTVIVVGTTIVVSFEAEPLSAQLEIVVSRSVSRPPNPDMWAEKNGIPSSCVIVGAQTVLCTLPHYATCHSAHREGESQTRLKKSEWLVKRMAAPHARCKYKRVKTDERSQRITARAFWKGTDSVSRKGIKETNTDLTSTPDPRRSSRSEMSVTLKARM